MGAYDYKEIEGDITKQEILDRESFYGFEPTNPLTLDVAYEKLYDQLVDDKSILTSNRFMGSCVSIKQLKNSLSLWDDLGIKLHEIDILDSSFDKIKNGKFVITQEFIDAIKSAHPFYLPITFNKGKKGKMYGHVESLDMRSPSNNPEENGVIYVSVELSKVNSKLATCFYNHEIAHTQMDSGVCSKSLLDTETIPILIEEIFASKIDENKTLEKLRNIRLLDLIKKLYVYENVHNLAYVSRIDSDTYIKSTLQAIKLANIYLKGNEKIKKEMQEYINRIFAEERCVQDMLYDYDASLERVPKNLSKLKVPR